VPTAYLTDETLQELVLREQNEAANDENEDEEEHGDIDKSANYADGFLKYSVGQVEALASIGGADSNLKQVEAKLLDFDWIFIGDNASSFLQTLAETDNDEIFSCSQVRVFVEFMWKGYYDAIYQTLFLPYIAYFVSFSLFATYFGQIESNTLSWGFIMQMACLVVFGKTFVTFFILEIIQFKSDPKNYFFSFWNIMDFTSLVACAGYVFCECTNALSENQLNIMGSIAVLLLWLKLFYWMRLFKQFSAFIRIISEIIKDIQVFSAMLFLCLAAFANCIIVLQNNRKGTDSPPIFDSFTGIEPFDAIIHAYLTGLGDFNKDNYSEGNDITIWLFFLFATILVQLVFMNMLIAIMGESFGRITAI